MQLHRGRTAGRMFHVEHSSEYIGLTVGTQRQYLIIGTLHNSSSRLANPCFTQLLLLYGSLLQHPPVRLLIPSDGTVISVRRQVHEQNRYIGRRYP